MFQLTVLLLLLSVSQHQSQIKAATVASINNVTTAPTLPCVQQSQGGVICKNNSTCTMIGLVQSCLCPSVYFTGTDCGTLNLKAETVRNDVFETGITFFWPTQIYLADYHSVTTRTPLSETSSIRATEIPTGYTSQVTITGLEADNKEYLLCIIHKDDIGDIGNVTAGSYLMNATAVMERGLMRSELAYCGIVVTPYDLFGPYTIAAWAIACSIGLVLLLVICCRGIINCRDRPKREKMLAQVMGNLQFLKRGSSKRKEETQDS